MHSSVYHFTDNNRYSCTENVHITNQAKWKKRVYILKNSVPSHLYVMIYEDINEISPSVIKIRGNIKLNNKEVNIYIMLPCSYVAIKF